jgi:hypothetical protein
MPCLCRCAQIFCLFELSRKRNFISTKCICATIYKAFVWKRSAGCDKCCPGKKAYALPDVDCSKTTLPFDVTHLPSYMLCVLFFCRAFYKPVVHGIR